jgi:general secretion pathway protein M
MRAMIESWWRERTDRERRLLAVMLTLLAVVVGWLGVVRPLAIAQAEAEARHARAVVALADIRELQAQAERLGARPLLPVDASLVGFLERSAADAGLPVERLEAEGSERAVITVAAVRPAAFFGWAQRLEVRHGLIVDRLSATRNSDSTIAVQATFRRPGR